MSKIKVITLGGFLGAGKTTTAITTIEALREQGIKAVYIANDQGDGLVDRALSETRNVTAGEVTGGCFCCKFEDLMQTIETLVAEHQPEVILAEAVGSCTDLMATVIRPLQQFHQDRFEVAPYTVLLDAQRYQDMKKIIGTKLQYLFAKQLEEAQVVAISKQDVLTDAEIEDLKAQVQVLAPQAKVLAFSSVTRKGLPELLSVWTDLNTSLLPGHSLDVDYDTYADAEALLGWVNITAQIQPTEGGFHPHTWSETFFECLRHGIQRNNTIVGHIKIQLSDVLGHTKASLVSTHGSHRYDVQHTGSSDGVSALINARAEASPDDLVRLIQISIQYADETCQTTTEVGDLAAFRPGYPTPVHRIVTEV